MKKRKKILLLCSVLFVLAGLGVTIPLLITGEDSSQSSSTDTSLEEVSVSTSSSMESSPTSEETSASLSTQISDEDSSEEDSEDSSENDESSEDISQTSDSMSEVNDSSSPPALPTPTGYLTLGSNSLSIPYGEGESGTCYAFQVPETGVYVLFSQSITTSVEEYDLHYTVNGITNCITSEKTTLSLQKGDVLSFIAYLHDDSLFVEGVFQMDVTITRQLSLGENSLSITDRCAVYFTAPSDGTYVFNASDNVRILCFSSSSLHYEEVTQPLSLTAGQVLELILQGEGEQHCTITISK